MARPLSEDKRDAILASAAELVATLGTSAPTAKIAKGAGVAEGTLFTYFPDKDALLAALFLDIEGELAKKMLGDIPEGASPRERFRHFWDRFIDWGAAHPARRKALKQLKVSDRIGEECRRGGERLFAEFRAALEEALGDGQSPEYVGAVLGALAETTLEFIAREPGRHYYHRARGFETFWKAIAR
jgi:AcrR family transcriptional regulator